MTARRRCPVTVQELNEIGIIQESTRQWFHPLGLELQMDVAGNMTLLDLRDQNNGAGPKAKRGTLDEGRRQSFELYQTGRHNWRKFKLKRVVQLMPGESDYVGSPAYQSKKRHYSKTVERA